MLSFRFHPETEGKPAHSRVPLHLHQMARQTGGWELACLTCPVPMYGRKAALPLSVDQVSGIVQNTLTFLECQAWAREAITNHTALQTCHGQKSLLDTAVPAQEQSTHVHNVNLVLNIPLCRKTEEPAFTFYHFKCTHTAKLPSQYEMPPKGALCFLTFKWLRCHDQLS